VAWWLVLMVCVLQGCAFLPATVARSAAFAFTDTGETPLARLVVALTPEAQRGLSGFRILPTGATMRSTRAWRWRAAPCD
jgi:hypothetical protein